EHNNVALTTEVGPPRFHGSTWWASHHGAGIVQLGAAQPRSRVMSARRGSVVKSRVFCPISSTAPCEPSTAGINSASQDSARLGDRTWTTTVPWLHVVGIAPRCGDRAVGCRAAAVPCDERSSLIGREESRFLSHLQHRAL